MCRTYSPLLSLCSPFPEVVWGSFKALGGSKDTGLVICAHCKCMADLGEACCHISAVLFTLEINTKLKDSMSCTSPRALDCCHHFNLFRVCQCLRSSLQHRTRRRVLPSMYQLAAVNHSLSEILLHQEKKCKISSSN